MPCGVVRMKPWRAKLLSTQTFHSAIVPCICLRVQAVWWWVPLTFTPPHVKVRCTPGRITVSLGTRHVRPPFLLRRLRFVPALALLWMLPIMMVCPHVHREHGALCGQRNFLLSVLETARARVELRLLEVLCVWQTRTTTSGALWYFAPRCSIFSQVFMISGHQ